MKLQFKIMRIVTVVGILVLFPVCLDWLVFGNNIPSNLTNGEWAGFLGSYIGSIATIAGVYLTIRWERQDRKQDQKMSIKPFIDVRSTFVKKDDVCNENDLVFHMKNDQVRYISHSLPANMKYVLDREGMSIAYIKLVAINCGAGNTMDMSININGFRTTQLILKDEKVQWFLIINYEDVEHINIRIELNYCDIQHLGEYNQSIEFTVNNIEATISPLKKMAREK